MNKKLIENYCLNLELEENILTIKLVPIKHVLCFPFFVFLNLCNDQLYYSSDFLSVFWSFYNIQFSYRASYKSPSNSCLQIVIMIPDNFSPLQRKIFCNN